jgi:hypothetical protein
MATGDALQDQAAQQLHANAMAVPHDAEFEHDHAPMSKTHNEENERQIFQYLLKPGDSYTSEGVYWADLPIGKRAAFVGATDAAEARKELGTIGDMIRNDPLSPVTWYFRNAVIPGAGLGLEGFVFYTFPSGKQFINSH